MHMDHSNFIMPLACRQSVFASIHLFVFFDMQKLISQTWMYYLAHPEQMRKKIPLIRRQKGTDWVECSRFLLL